MATREQALAELYRRKALNPQQMAAVEELARRGVVQLPTAEQPEQALREQAGELPTPQEIARQDAYKATAEEVGPGQAALIGIGRGFTTFGRGLGLIDQEDESEKQAYQALKEHRPYTTGAGEIIGESAPFIAAGGGAGLAARTLLPKLGAAGASALGAAETVGGRAAATGTLGALEGATIAAGSDRNVTEGALLGALFGAGSEFLLPAAGRVVKNLSRKYRGIPPEGALLDANGRPTPELQQALDEQNLSFDDLTQNAQDVISQQTAGAVPEQVARAAEFEQAGVRGTRGDITQQFEDQATEARLLQSARDPKADPFRQYKLAQSQDIDRHLSENLADDVTDEETGTLIKEALTGRKKLLRTEKNQLYEEFKQASREAGEIPVFTDNIAESIPLSADLEDLAITAPTSMKALDGILTRYGLKEPTEEALDSGFQPVTLTAENFERFRKSLNAIERGDQTGAVKVATGPIKRALDTEIDEMAEHLSGLGFSEEITGPIKEARKRVRTLKTEFSPQSAIGRLVDVARDGETAITEASKVYSNKIAARSVPVENVRKIIGSLKKAGEQGESAIASIQTTTMLDVINAGFGTKSRKIDGIRIFNPIAFKNRLDAIGQPKLKAIFSDNPQLLNRLKNIDKISESLIKSSDAEPKGSSSTILELMDKLQISAITSKVPLIGPAFNEFLQTVLQGQRTRKEVGQAIQGNPEVQKLANILDTTYPGIASSLGIAGVEKYRERSADDSQ